MRHESGILQIQCATQKGILPIKERKWKRIPAYPSFRGRTLATGISKFVMRMLRHYDQVERDTDGAVHWDTINPK